MPRLGSDVPQWFGETIGFWDGEALITWTSNIQGWISHGGSEFSNKLQSIEIYTPRKDASGKLIGIKHEAVLYDEDAFVDPVRIVQTWDRLGRLNENEPLVIMECVPHIFPVQGNATPKSPGDDVRVHAAGHLRPAVGADLGALPRAGHGAAAGKRPVFLSGGS